MILNSLQQDFTELVQRQPKLPVLAPAYFFENQIVTKPDTNFTPISDHVPFDAFWFIYQTSNGPLGYIQNFLLIQDREVRLWTRGSFHRQLVLSATFDLDDPQSGEVAFGQAKLAIAETLPEIRVALDRVMNHEREEAVPAYLKRLNKQRNRAQTKSIPAYIVVKPTRIVRPTVATGTGKKQCPHVRGGYTRVMRKSGKIIKVDAYPVHGGCNRPRDYRVTS